MGLYILFGTLAAFGLFCALWALLSLWLSGSRGWAAVCFDPAAVRRCRLLQSWGLLRGPILAVDCCFPEKATDHDLREDAGVEFCSLEALASRLEQERRSFAGTGKRDHSGNHRRGGISKL